MKIQASVLSLLVLGFTLATPVAHADSVRRFSHTGPEGGQVAGRRAIRTDGAGNGMVTSGGALRTPNGGVAGRAGVTTRSADGSVTHRSAMGATSDKGSVYSTGTATKDADGNVTQQRNTQMTNAATGNSYNGSTSYNTSTGLTRSGTCYDASGAVIACPTR